MKGYLQSPHSFGYYEPDTCELELEIDDKKADRSRTE